MVLYHVLGVHSIKKESRNCKTTLRTASNCLLIPDLQTFPLLRPGDSDPFHSVCLRSLIIGVQCTTCLAALGLPPGSNQKWLYRVQWAVALGLSCTWQAPTAKLQTAGTIVEYC